MSRLLASRSGALLAIVSAALFGASTPLAKLLLGNGIDPWLLAALLYLGAGVALFALGMERHEDRAVAALSQVASQL